MPIPQYPLGRVEPYPRPFIYLDYWAMRLFADEVIRGDRLLRILQRGTLLLSIMNLAEIARPKSGESVQSVENYLDAVGPRWTILNWSREEVSKREALGYREPWLDERWTRMARSTFAASLRSLVRRLREPWAQAMLDEWEAEAKKVMELVELVRASVRAKTLVLDGSPLPGSAGCNAVFEVVLQKLTTSTLRLDRNQLDDLIHATVPLAHADVVFMDERTASLLNRTPLRRKAFWRAEVDDALFIAGHGFRPSLP